MDYNKKIQLILAFSDKAYIKEFCQSAKDLIEYDADIYPSQKQIFWIDKWYSHYLSKANQQLTAETKEKVIG